MKLSNAQMETYLQGLDTCHNASGFPGMLIGIAHRRIANEIKEYLLEKQKIFEKYGEKTENGWRIPQGSPEFKKTVSEILSISEITSEIDIPQFSEEEFMEKFQSDSLTAENYEILYEIFVKKEGEINGDKQ